VVPKRRLREAMGPLCGARDIYMKDVAEGSRVVLEDVRSGRTIVMQKMWLRYLACEELKQQAGVI
jgi:hypothetical protein